MTDWKVKVQTDNSYVKEVIVYDYISPQDAVDSALAQTGASSYITCVPYYGNSYSDATNRNYESNRNRQSVSSNPNTELEFVFWVTLGMLFVMISIPIAFVIFSIMTIRLAMSN